MSVIDRVLLGLRRIPRGFSADGRQLGLGLSAALDAQRARGAEPLDRVSVDREPGDRRDVSRAGRADVADADRAAR
ncbi:hypothetical protein [Pseudonocardia parietis]|uniref:Thiolase-like protein n=1 Tax=Pseudonocardia parietis TaxID=570936 RepID=A0ABS4VVL5_9PSEU|nr:hypothetical protein [Pseudonocardia parietis]MBP2367987.1 hypothetical protein [Pseudonocardia parietis]